MAVRFRGIQQVAFRADITRQRHDHVFSNRIDGRVRNLSKQLFEIVVEHPWLVAKAGER